MSNYRQLLIKYIKHVKSCEGTDFIDLGFTLSKQERKELKDLMNEERKSGYRKVIAMDVKGVVDYE